ncbi:DUF4180 domain-containing protein [Dactylosporangium sp. NPDC005555]|uniref:DUF4180 domain-containing protein n=1 Tax=Dactylosporangium sp. NPDC005555 TaxID=3154889 RepID=UPI0033AAF57B
MDPTVTTLHGLATLILPEDGPAVGTELDAGDLVGAALEHDAELLVVPAARIAAEFWTLRTGVAGEILQKLVNYRVRLAVVGDITAPVEASTALSDLVRESNRRRDAWFLPDIAALDERLRGPRG